MEITYLGHSCFKLKGKTGTVVIDPFDGQKDLKNKTIRAVGDPDERFSEDALRMMRAIRLGAELGFGIESLTLEAIKKNKDLIKEISWERIRDEFLKIIASPFPADGVKLLHGTELLEIILPELVKGAGVPQGGHHIYDVFTHGLESLRFCPSLDVWVRLATLLHDVGKAVTHKVEGKHHHIGAELARKYGMSDEIVHAIEAHHDDIEATTVEALVVRVCDALSAARPGARNISAENFSERMRDLENIANSFPGIEKSYAISAGREVRVMVRPENIDDLTAIKLARDIANKIESTMQYPGTIKINVIRETRAIEYAK